MCIQIQYEHCITVRHKERGAEECGLLHLHVTGFTGLADQIAARVCPGKPGIPINPVTPATAENVKMSPFCSVAIHGVSWSQMNLDDCPVRRTLNVSAFRAELTRLFPSAPASLRLMGLGSMPPAFGSPPSMLSYGIDYGREEKSTLFHGKTRKAEVAKRQKPTHSHTSALRWGSYRM